MTEQFVVPHVTFKPASLSQLSVCLSFAVKSGISFRGSFSCQSFTLTGTHLLQSDVSFSALSAGNLLVCAKRHSSASIWCLYQQ